MQNLIVFCQYCSAWVEPFSTLCPECGTEVQLDQPDPDIGDLTVRLGRQLMVLGPVCVERHGLPNYGYLIGTTQGILFLPRLHRRINGAWEGVTSQRLPGWWPFRGDMKSPRFLSWLRKPFIAQGHADEKSLPVLELNSGSLANRLMDSPGAFFVEHRTIHGLVGRRRTVKIERPPLRSVTLIDETEGGSLIASLNDLSAQVARIELKSAL